jgi:hypothetical protein
MLALQLVLLLAQLTPLLFCPRLGERSATHVVGSLLIRALIIPSLGHSASEPIDEVGIRMAASLALSLLAGDLT